MAAARVFVALCLLGLLAAPTGASAAAAAGSGEVVQRVVTLIEELKAKIEQDGKIEQKMYDKSACWCETTSARKANDIHQAMADIKALSAKILQAKGLVATRTSEIAGLSRDIEENNRVQAEATG